MYKLIQINSYEFVWCVYGQQMESWKRCNAMDAMIVTRTHLNVVWKNRENKENLLSDEC